MEEMDAKFSTGEKVCWELENEKYSEWGANALMYMLLSVAIQWAGQALICLDSMQEEKNDDVGYVGPYDDNPWGMNNEDEFGYAKPRTWNATKSELVFDFGGSSKWYVRMPDWKRTQWPFDPSGGMVT